MTRGPIFGCVYAILNDKLSKNHKATGQFGELDSLPPLENLISMIFGSPLYLLLLWGHWWMTKGKLGPVRQCGAQVLKDHFCMIQGSKLPDIIFVNGPLLLSNFRWLKCNTSFIKNKYEPMTYVNFANRRLTAESNY